MATCINPIIIDQLHHDSMTSQAFKAAYEAHVAERAQQGIPPLALDSSQDRAAFKNPFVVWW